MFIIRKSPWLVFLISLISFIPTGCDEECEEPDSRGDGEVGDACTTTADCLESLMCFGANFEENALCVEWSDVPRASDPGCLEHADDWEDHAAFFVQPIGDDEEGCEQLLFVSGCNCSGSGECVPQQPFNRRELWRRCNGCCWVLVSLWQDDELCDG